MWTFWQNCFILKIKFVPEELIKLLIINRMDIILWILEFFMKNSFY